MNNDLISREALKKAIHSSNLSLNREWLLMDLDKIIDNAPTVDPICEDKACKYRANERAQGEWYEYIDKGLLKARRGDYVLYKVDYLLDNLAREVNIMESTRKMKGGAE